MWSDGVCCAGHGTTSDDGEILLVVDRGFRVQALLRANMAQRGIGGGLLEISGGRMRARVVADQVEVLAGGRRDAEGLLHQPVGLIPVAIWAFVGAFSAVFIAAASAFRRLAASGRGVLRNTAAAATLASITP
jgi:hypothetical protein